MLQTKSLLSHPLPQLMCYSHGVTHLKTLPRYVLSSVADPQSAHRAVCGAASFFVSLGDPPEAYSLEAATQITPNMGATEVTKPTSKIASASATPQWFYLPTCPRLYHSISR